MRSKEPAIAKFFTHALPTTCISISQGHTFEFAVSQLIKILSEYTTKRMNECQYRFLQRSNSNPTFVYEILVILFLLV